MSGIHHFVPVLHRGDAVGRHTLRLRGRPPGARLRSEIYVDTVDAETAGEALPVLSYPEAAQPGDVVVYQFATASAMAPWLAGRPETLVVNYHNITPPELMAPWDNHLALGQLRAQGDLRLLAPRTALAVADSAYNEAHLAAAGFVATAVIPPSAALDAGMTTGGRPAQLLLHRRDRWRCTLAGRRQGLAQQGAREHRRRVRRGPRPRRPRGHAAHHRQAGDGLLRRRAAALRGGAGAGRRGRFAGHASDATVASAYAARRRAGRDLGARGLLRAGGRGDVRRPAGRGLRPGRGPRGVGRGRGLWSPTRTRTRLAASIAAVLADAPRRDAMAAAGAGAWPSSISSPAADRLVDLLVPLAERGAALVTGGPRCPD